MTRAELADEIAIAAVYCAATGCDDSRRGSVSRWLDTRTNPLGDWHELVGYARGLLDGRTTTSAVPTSSLPDTDPGRPMPEFW